MQASMAQAKAPAAAPPADVPPRQYLRLGVGSEMFAAPIAVVREILEVGQMTPLPQTPAFVRGVMNLRGAVVPVIDLAARFGAPASQISRRTCIVVVEVHAEAAADEEDQRRNHHVVGMLVDAVYEVFESADADLEDVPLMGTRVDAEHLKAMTRVRGEVCAVLDLDHLLAQGTLAQLIAQQPALS